MHPPAVPSFWRAGVLALALAATGAAPGGLPPIVFVSRNPVPDDPSAIPGLGPHHRAVATGGRLLVRERDGRVRELLPAGAFYDVSDPSVSPDARRITFAAVAHRDSSWHIWVVGLEGEDLRQVTFDLPHLRSRGEGDDDLDPCWINDTSLVFASTRDTQRAQYADVAVTNLYLTSAPSATRSYGYLRITSERNAAEEPTMDWRRRRIVFSRWWFNRYQAARDASGITTDPAMALTRDTVNLWQTMEMSPGARVPRLAAGDLRTRRGTMGYQPALLADGTIVSVYAANLGLSPRPGGTGIHALARDFGGERRLAGALVPGRGGDAYAGTEGLAPPSACAPAGLPDGRVLFSYDPGARGDFGLYVMRADGTRLARLLDFPGTLELDAAPVVRHRLPPREPPLAGDELEQPPPAPGPDGIIHITLSSTFRYHALDVFADGPPGSPARGAAPRTEGARIRFYRTLPRPWREGGDTAVLVREAPVGPRGEVNERGLPADTPMFEQLVDREGRALMTAHGPAHVAGSNAGTAGTTSRCVGCHLGHSTLPVEITASRAKRARR
ncbi:MAG: TolB family protein [Candidatus Eiseniibacteriota bacterium]